MLQWMHLYSENTNCLENIQMQLSLSASNQPCFGKTVANVFALSYNTSHRFEIPPNTTVQILGTDHHRMVLIQTRSLESETQPSVGWIELKYLLQSVCWQNFFLIVLGSRLEQTRGIVSFYFGRRYIYQINNNGMEV
jgi:hypothetical protein